MMQKATIRMLAAAMCLSMTAPLTAAASAEDVERLNKIIEELPAEEDLTGEQADDVKAAMELYQSLTTAEKLEIEGYGKLEKEYETLLSGGLIRDEKKEKEKEQKRQESEQEKLRESESTESESTSYVFNVTDKKQGLSIVLRYTTDRDGDGYGDVPDRIVLTSPYGTTTALSNANASMSDETMEIACQWEKKFLQLDIAYAQKGKWKITTSEPVTFSRMPYAGVRQEIRPEDEKTKDDASAAAEEDTAPKKKGFSWWKLIVILFLLVCLMFLRIRFRPGTAARKKKCRKKKSEDDEDDDVEAPRPLSDEELRQQLLKEHEEREEQERLLDEQDLEEEQEYFRRRDEEAEETLAEYTEGDTDLLNKKDNPTLNGGGLRTDGSFFGNGRFD